jgi:hypothetical protein
MNFYAYISHVELGHEPLGTDGRMLFCLKTTRGAIKHVSRQWKAKWSLYTYSNFFDDSTFKLIQKG